MTDYYDLAIIGEGIAGLACAARATELGLSVATFEGNMFGGLVLNISALHGYEAGRPGVELASELMEANMAAGVVSHGAATVAISGRDDSFELTTDNGVTRARKVVAATGARLRTLGVPGEDRLKHRGVSQCVDCDGPMLSGKAAVVVGGGDSAYMQAGVLAQYASTVSLIVRSRAPRARDAFVQSVAANDRITVLSCTSVLEILGCNEGTSVKVSTEGKDQIITCAGVFVYVGLRPNTDLLETMTQQDPFGAIMTDSTLQTSQRGLYAIGAVRAGYSGDLGDAVKEATQAAEHASARLSEKG